MIDVRWTSDDLSKYIQAKEYIDTAIIPLVGFQMNTENKMEKDAFQREVLSIYTNEIEKELSGRLLLAPNYNYIKTKDLSEEVTRLNKWVEHINEQPFSNIFLLTFDNQWKKEEKNLDGELLWFPSLEHDSLKSEETIRTIRSQVNQISELIRTYW